MDWLGLVSIVLVALIGVWQIRLQLQVNKLEEQRREEEVDAKSRAAVRVWMLTKVTPRVMNGQTWHLRDEYVQITNDGPAQARDVNLRAWSRQAPDETIIHPGNDLPLASLDANSTHSIIAGIDQFDPGPFDYHLTWTDGAGTHEKGGQLPEPRS